METAEQTVTKQMQKQRNVKSQRKEMGLFEVRFN